MNRLSCVLAIILVLYVMLSACLEETGGAGRTAAGDSAAETNTGGVPSSMSPGAAGDTELSYTAGTKISTAESHSGHSYLSTVADQNALLIDTSDFVSITVPAVSKTGDSDGGDKCSFYGLNAAVLVKGGSTTVIAGGTVTSDANGANGVFCYGGNGGQNGASGDGATVMISDTVITTTGDGSGGIMTTGGGVTKATNLNVFTSGQSSAAIRTDRGGGAVTVDGGHLYHQRARISRHLFQGGHFRRKRIPGIQSLRRRGYRGKKLDHPHKRRFDREQYPMLRQRSLS